MHSKSHYVICERVIKALALKGHQVDAYSHFPSSKPIPNFKDFSLAGSLPDLKNNVSYERTLEGRKFKVGAFMNSVGTNLCQIMSKPMFQELLKNPPQDPPYDLVIVEVRQ